MDFNFIASAELRQNLDNEYAELQMCLRARAWKAVHLLAGSIVEAVLAEALGVSGQPLPELVAVARRQGFLDAEAAALSTVVQNYRALIHPDPSVRLEKSVDEPGAVVAKQLIKIIAAQVARKKQSLYGPTPAQMLDLLRTGAEGRPAPVHLLAGARPEAIEELLAVLLPSLVQMAESPALEQVYRAVFDTAEPDLQRRVLERAAASLSRRLLLASDLALVDGAVRDRLKQRLLSGLSPENLGARLAQLAGIGRYLSEAETAEYYEVLACAIEGDDAKLAEQARERYVQEFGKLTAACRKVALAAAHGFGDAALTEKLERREARHA